MKEIYKEIKEELKSLAIEIKNLKTERNDSFRENDIDKASTIQWKHLPRAKYEYRHKHIARCELKGRNRNQIEIPNENNQPNETYIKQIKEEWIKRLNETICLDEKRLVA